MGALEEGAVPESSAGEAEGGAVGEPSAKGPSEVGTVGQEPHK